MKYQHQNTGHTTPDSKFIRNDFNHAINDTEKNEKLNYNINCKKIFQIQDSFLQTFVTNSENLSFQGNAKRIKECFKEIYNKKV